MVTKEGFDFGFNPDECEHCGGRCCIGESGYIWITTAEIKRLSEHLDVSIPELHKNHLTKVRHKFSINEMPLGNDEYACIYFDTDKKQCSIYDVRPNQCRTFPFWNHYKIEKDEIFYDCPAISLSLDPH